MNYYQFFPVTVRYRSVRAYQRVAQRVRLIDEWDTNDVTVRLRPSLRTIEVGGMRDTSEVTDRLEELLAVLSLPLEDRDDPIHTVAWIDGGTGGILGEDYPLRQLVEYRAHGGQVEVLEASTALTAASVRRVLDERPPDLVTVSRWNFNHEIDKILMPAGARYRELRRELFRTPAV